MAPVRTPRSTSTLCNAMTIVDAHKMVYSHVGVPLSLDELRGQRVALDVAWWKLRAWYADAPSFYRPGAAQTHEYRFVLSRLLSVLSLAVGPGNLIVVLDGAFFWPKAATHAQRAAIDRDQVLRDAAALDAGGKRHDADKKYRELTYPVPPLVDEWLVAHCSSADSSRRARDLC